MAFRIEVEPLVVPGHRQAIDKCRGFNAWQRLGASINVS